MNIQASVQLLSVVILPLLFAITLHEAAHGYVASKLGDKTALMLGRVSLNPMKHIDPFGTVIVPLVMLLMTSFLFGWAKPVPVTWQNLKHPRRDMALVALAGPFANVLMALAWALVAKMMLWLGSTYFTDPGTFEANILKFFYQAGQYGIFINLILMVLNLLPIPPLDGSRVLSSILPGRWAYYYERIEPYGIWILLALLFLGLFRFLLLPVVFYLMAIVKALFGLP